MPQRRMTGSGSVVITKSRDRIKTILLDPAALRSLVPNAIWVSERDPGRYEGALNFGLGPLQGRYSIAIMVTEPAPFVFAIEGTSHGRLGEGSAAATLRLRELRPGHTEIEWHYDGIITGPISRIGNRIQRFAAKSFIDRFFARLGEYKSC